MSKDILQRIRFFRESKGYSQEYVATRLSIKQNTYARIEQNIIKLDVDRLIKISQLLEVDLYLLLTGKIQSTYVVNDTESYIQDLISVIKMQEEEIRTLKYVLGY